MILLNEDEHASLPITDRAIQYGDGCFTTLLYKKGTICYLSAHLDRLKLNTKRLGIFGISWDKLESGIYQVVKKRSLAPFFVIKVLVSRGVGGRGYSPKGCHEPNVLITTHDYPLHYLNWQQTGIHLGIAKQQLGLSLLGGIKHLNRLEQVLIKAEVDASKYDDLLVCDLNKKLVETSIANVFWRKKNRLFTPMIELSGVAGIMRANVMKLVEQSGYSISEVKADISDIQTADEIFITNALMEIVPVNALEEKPLTDFSSCMAIRSRLPK